MDEQSDPTTVHSPSKEKKQKQKEAPNQQNKPKNNLRGKC